jgi:hypothetical protein
VIEFRKGQNFRTRPDRTWVLTQTPIQQSWGYGDRGVALTTNPHLAPRLKNECSYISTPPLCLHGLLKGDLFHNTQPTKCRILFLRYLYNNITLIPTCFDPHWNIIREQNHSNSTMMIPGGLEHAGVFSARLFYKYLRKNIVKFVGWVLQFCYQHRTEWIIKMRSSSSKGLLCWTMTSPPPPPNSPVYEPRRFCSNQNALVINKYLLSAGL